VGYERKGIFLSSGVFVLLSFRVNRPVFIWRVQFWKPEFSLRVSLAAIPGFKLVMSGLGGPGAAC
jgi:hypothetical protein